MTGSDEVKPDAGLRSDAVKRSLNGANVVLVGSIVESATFLLVEFFACPQN